MSQPIAPFAATPVYPAGASSWSGTPTKVAPAVTYLTPNQPQGLTAQNLNFLLNQRDAIASAVAIGMWAGAAANWNTPTVNVGAPSLPAAAPYCACFDAFFQQWIVAGEASANGPFLTCSYDGGKNFFPLAGAFPTPATRPIAFSVATNPTTGDLCAFRTDFSTCSVTRWAAGVGTPVDVSQSFLAGCDLGVLAFFDGDFWFVGSSGLLAGSWTGFSASSSNGAGAWTNQSGTLPSGWGSSGANLVQQYIAAQSTTTLAVAMCGATPGTSTSRLMSMAAGGSWTDITPALLGGAAQEIRGLCYSVNDGLWGLLSQDASGNSYLYTSPDLATWTLVQKFTGFWSCGVAVIGSVWSVLVYNVTAEEGGNRIVYSQNVALSGAASTWTFGGYAEGINGESTSLPSNPCGLLLGNAGAVGGAIENGIASAPNVVGSQMLRVEIFRFAGVGGTVASSGIAGFVGAIPTAPILAAPTGPSAYGVDTFTLHRWQCNDAATPLADTGVGANAPLTVQNASTTNSLYQNTGLFIDSVSFHGTVYGKSLSNVGNPASTTLISLHGWVKVRTLPTSTQYPRLLSKDRDGTNESLSLVLSGSGTLGSFYAQWYSGGFLDAAPAAVTLAVPALNQWCHIGATFSQAAGNMTVCFYMNGNLLGPAQVVASGVIDWNAGSSGPWYLGQYLSGAPLDAWFMDWRLDDGVARPAAYFKSLYQAGTFVHS